MPQPQQSKRAQLARNIGYGVMSWLLPLVPTLVATPIVIRKLGKDQYGVLLILMGFISYFFTAMIGKVAAKYVAEFLSTGEQESISPVISATLIASTGATFICAGAAAIAAGPIVDSVLRIPQPLRDDAVLGVYLASATVLTASAAQTFIQLLQGLHRFERYFLLANFISGSFSLGGLALAWAGYGFVEILVLNLVTWALAGIAAIAFVRQALPSFVFTFEVPKRIWVLVARYAAGIVGYQLFGVVLLLFERAWIMRHFGPEALTLYGVPMALAMFIHAFTSSLLVSIFPTLNELTESPEKLRILYRHSTKVVLGLTVFAVVTAAICSRLFLTVWLRDSAFAEAASALLIVHTVTFSILALNTIAWHVAESFRAASINAYATFGWMVIGIGAIFLLSPEWQLMGVGTARLIGVLPLIPVIFFVEHRFMGSVEWVFWGKCVLQLAACAALAAAAELMVMRFLGTTWISVIVTVGLGAAAYCVAGVAFRYVSLKDLENIRDFVLRRHAIEPVGSEAA